MTRDDYHYLRRLPKRSRRYVSPRPRHDAALAAVIVEARYKFFIGSFRHHSSSPRRSATPTPRRRRF